jgi:hypothetical protein
MVYTVGFGKRNKPGISAARTNTAQEAIELAEALTRSGNPVHQHVDRWPGRHRYAACSRQRRGR